MLIKCGREEFNVDLTDLVMYNRACYQLITKKTGRGWYEWSPIIAKDKADKMIKSGVLVLRNSTGEGKSKLDYYQFSKEAE